MRQIRSAWLWIALIGTVYGMEDSHQKHSLRCDMSHMYQDDPEEVETISDMFSQGIFYGRLRFNSFGFKWENEIDSAGVKVRKNHTIGAIGGSLIYKSAYLNGFGIGAGVYTSGSQGSLNTDEAYLYKPGKGVLSRYNALTQGKESLTSLAEAYLEYKHEDVTIKAGTTDLCKFFNQK